MPGFSDPAVLAKAQATRLANKLKKQEKSNGHKHSVVPVEDSLLHEHRPWEKMSIKAIEQKLTEIYKDYQEGIRVMREKMASKDESTTMVPCACGCGDYIDIAHGRWASSQAQRDKVNPQIIRTIYWKTQNCVMRYQLKNSPEYKAEQAAKHPLA